MVRDAIADGADRGSPTRTPATDGSEAPGARLVAFVQATRRVGRVRAWSIWAVDAGLGVVGLGIASTLVAAWTLRGDLAAYAWLLVSGAALIATAVRAGRLTARKFGTPLRTAKTIATTPGALTDARTAERVSRERALRHEVLGAFELVLDPVHVGSRSDSLRRAYIGDVERRLTEGQIGPSRAVPRPRSRRRVWTAAGLMVAVCIGATIAAFVHGAILLVNAEDGRPPPPLEPVWSTLELELRYPPHVGRPPRTVPNPSGALRVPAGTEVAVQFTPRFAAPAARIVVAYDSSELSHAPEPEIFELDRRSEPSVQFMGAFTSRSSGSWTIVLLDDDDDDVLDDASRRSAALPLVLEPDRPPEVELLPLPRASQNAHERETIDIRFHARDDFGLRSAELVFSLPDGSSHRLPATPPAQPTRTWRQRLTWDLSQIPIKERSEIIYWIEVRDNDPGLGMVPLDDPPGKLSRSATMRLVVEDDEAEHAANIVRIAETRDAAVDLLALRMTTAAFDPKPQLATLATPPVAVRAATARDLLARAAQLLAMLAATIDDLSIDTMAHERDVASLTGIHGRLSKLHRAELELHERLPPESERLDPARAAQALVRMRGHNGKETTQLEDEIIRLDDLVDTQIIERLEALVARLEATQRTLVELLEQLQAGDDSVRPRIDQLEQRRREDLRRIAEARAMLREEVEQEFMNLDAFRILEQMNQREQVSEMLRRGELDQALEQARGQLDDVRTLRDQVQERAGAAGPGTEGLSEEERQRMQLLRELSRLQDEEGNIRDRTSAIDRKWKDQVGGIAAEDAAKEDAARTAQSLKKAFDDINDARLGREARRGLDDAKQLVERLQAAAGNDATKQLELAETARRLAEQLRAAQAGSEAHEREGKALRRAKDRAEALERSMLGGLPGVGEKLSPSEREDLSGLRRQQEGLRRRVDELMRAELSSPLPNAGRRAMRSADRGMSRSAAQLGSEAPRAAMNGQSEAWEGIGRAIDSLRSGPPPPPPAQSGDASTEAERDRSLRDALMDAMREGAPEGYGEPVKRYYEELLR